MTFFQAFFWRIVPKKGSNNALKCGLKYDFFGQKRQKSHNFSFKKYRRYWILRIRDSRLLDTVKTSEISFSRILMINILRLDYKCKKAREQVVHELGTLFPCIGSTFLFFFDLWQQQHIQKIISMPDIKLNPKQRPSKPPVLAT